MDAADYRPQTRGQAPTSRAPGPRLERAAGQALLKPLQEPTVQRSSEASRATVREVKANKYSPPFVDMVLQNACYVCNAIAPCPMVGSLLVIQNRHEFPSPNSVGSWLSGLRTTCGAPINENIRVEQ
jgi:hypothetical protein